MKLLTTLVLSCLIACKAPSYQTLSVSAFQRCRLRRTTGRQRLFTIYIKSTDNLEHLKRKAYFSTGSPSSKYEHWRASALLRNIQNIRICMGK